jgi:hypothetical protein
MAKNSELIEKIVISYIIIVKTDKKQWRNGNLVLDKRKGE